MGPELLPVDPASPEATAAASDALRAAAEAAADDQRVRVGELRTKSLGLAAGVVAMVVAGLLILAVVVAVRPGIGLAPGSGVTTAAEKPPARTPKVVPFRPPKPRRTASRGQVAPGYGVGQLTRRFAWAPVPGATGYHLELKRRGNTVFATDTTVPEATIPTSWMIRGQRQMLEPGKYQWSVWPLVSGRRASGAIVQATLVIDAQ